MRCKKTDTQIGAYSTGKNIEFFKMAGIKQKDFALKMQITGFDINPTRF